MNEDDTFQMTRAELQDIVDARDAKTFEALQFFAAHIWAAVEAHPQGDLYDFLAFHTAEYIASVVFDEVISIGDPKEFFRACGFDVEMVERMVTRFEIGIELRKKMKLRREGEAGR